MPYLVLGLVLGVPLVAYVTLSAVLYRRLFVPERADWLADFMFTPWEFQADYEEVDLVTADGVAFGAWFFRQTASPQVIVLSPGHKAKRQDVLGIAVALWRKGFNVLCYSYRGMPGSDRALVTMGVREVQELAEAIAFARRPGRVVNSWPRGSSVGAVVSLLGASGAPSVEALVLDSPYADLGQVVRENIRRHALLPGSPFVAAMTLWMRLRHGVRLADARPL